MLFGMLGGDIPALNAKVCAGGWRLALNSIAECETTSLSGLNQIEQALQMVVMPGREYVLKSQMSVVG